MVLQLHLLAILGVILTSLIYLCMKIKEHLELKRQLKGFHSTKGWPLIGSLGLVVASSSEQIYNNMRKVIKENGDCFIFWLGTVPLVGLTSPTDIETLLSSMKHHRKGYIYKFLHSWLGTGLLTSQGDKWRTRRKILTPSFHFNILQKFLHVFNDHTAKLVDGLKMSAVRDGFDVLPTITDYTLNTICETAMGTTLGGEEEAGARRRYMDGVGALGEQLLQRLLRPWLMADGLFALTARGRRVATICSDLHAFSSSVINRREQAFTSVDLETLEGAEGAADSEGFLGKKRLAMLDVLLSTKYQKKTINNLGIREEVDTFIFEGHETTAMNMSFTLMLLACNKHCQDKVVEEFTQILGETHAPPTYTDLQELKYMERCIKESLRLYPSVPHIIRYSDGFLTSKGLWMPKDIDIVVPIYDLHRRPDLYPDPEKFDPDRFLPENAATRHPFAYIPFSAGPRNCIGQRFAMIEAKVMLVAILRNFILEPIDTPETISLVTHIVIKPKGSVKVKFVPRT